MPDPTNLISAELSDQDQAEALSLIDRLQQLLPFLTVVSDKEKRYLLYPGVRGLDAAAEMARVVTKYASHFPKTITEMLPEMERDMLLARVLRPVVKALQVITRAAEDTLHAARSDAFRSALVAYTFAKPLSKTTPGLKKDIETLTQYFGRASRGKRQTTDLDA
jgi:hypothetical protein